MIWLIGNKGMLGTDIEKLLKEKKVEYIASDKEIDITQKKQLEDFLTEKKPQWIINCSAYTAVDKAETDIENAFKINAEGVENIALIAKKFNSKLEIKSSPFKDKY